MTKTQKKVDPVPTAVPSDYRGVAYRSYLPLIILGLGILILLLALGIFRDLRATVHAFDTGLYLQILENLRSHGDFASSVTGEVNFLAHHFQPILVAILPLHMILPSASTLFVLDAIAIALSAFLLYRHFNGDLSPILLGAVILSIFVHPTVATRIFYGFVPETLALPLLTIQALILTKEAPLSKKDVWLLCAAQLLSGLCKETLWLINSTVSALLIFRFRTRPQIYVLLFLLNFTIFTYLFFVWMPTHTKMSQYYALRYFAHPSIGGSGLWDRLAAMFLNLISANSFYSLFFYVIALSGIVPFLGRSLNILASLPGIALILISSHPLIHQPTNHYLLLSLPFLWVSGLENLKKNKFWSKVPRLYSLLPIIFIAIPLTVTIPSLLKTWMVAQGDPRTQYIRQDMKELRKNLDKDHAIVLAEGNLQPLLADFRNVNVLLEFVGNPHKMTFEKLLTVTDVVTMFDPRTLASCDSLKAGSEDGLSYDYEAFYRYCHWIRRETFNVQTYPQSGLFHFQRVKL